MFLWRISRFADLSGKGGELVSGRWHEKGNPVVYCADHPSTMLLEMIVHVNPANIPDTYQLLKIECPDDILCGKAEKSERPLGLGRRERQAVDLLMEGMSESEIARSLGISENAVRHFLSDVSSKSDAISEAALDDFVQKILRFRVLDIDFTVKFGMDWLMQNDRCVLKVPSAVMPAATNYLLNPRHSHADRVRVVEIFEYPFDKRLK
jgi:RES domain-containing protein